MKIKHIRQAITTYCTVFFCIICFFKCDRMVQPDQWLPSEQQVTPPHWPAVSSKEAEANIFYDIHFGDLLLLHMHWFDSAHDYHLAGDSVAFRLNGKWLHYQCLQGVIRDTLKHRYQWAIMQGKCSFKLVVVFKNQRKFSSFYNYEPPCICIRTYGYYLNNIVFLWHRW